MLALNFLTPGLGLIRLGRLRAGLVFAFAPFVAMLVLAAFAMSGPQITPDGYLALVVIAVAATLLLCVSALVVTWASSRFVVQPVTRWRRWYALLAVVVLVQVAASGSVALNHARYKPFSIPAESMAPALELGDRFIADMCDRDQLGRGRMIIFAVYDQIYVKRIIALAGDRIEMRRGVPVLNGRRIQQRSVGTLRTVYGTATISEERLPGERGSHRVLDHGPHRFDDMAGRVIPPGHIFVLGDNRDRSADSRVLRAEYGVEMLPVEDVRGKPLFRTWDANFRWIGTPIG